jgi:hypothetical protein
VHFAAGMVLSAGAFTDSSLLSQSYLAFAPMVYIPDGAPHVQRSMMDDANYLTAIHSFFQVWYESHHRFPEDEEEFLDALRSGPDVWQYRVNVPSPQSDYAKGGIRLPYPFPAFRRCSFVA